MRTIHGAALFLAVAAVLTLSSEIVVSARMVAAPAGEGYPFPPESTCTKVIDVGRRCNADKCAADCSSRHQGVNSQCGAAGCICLYYCDPPSPAAAAAPAGAAN